MANPASGSEWLAKGVGKFNGPDCVGMEIIPGVSQVFGHASIDHHIMGKAWVEGVKEFIVVIRDHGRVEFMEDRVFEVALGIPGDLQGLSFGDSSRKVRMGNFFDPRFELLVESTSFNPIAGTVNRKESVLERL